MGKIKTLKNNVDSLVEKWLPLLGLYSWKVTISYCDGSVPDATSADVVAVCYADWRYMTADIYLSIPNTSSLSEEVLEEVIIHELFHAVVNEMRYEGVEHEERVVTMLTNSAKWIGERSEEIRQ